MFVLRDKRTQLYLRRFHGTYQAYRDTITFKLSKEMRRYPTVPEIHAAMWCRVAPLTAKTYRSRNGVRQSLHVECVQKDQNDEYRTLSLHMALPWLEIVEVKPEEVGAA